MEKNLARKELVKTWGREYCSREQEKTWDSKEGGDQVERKEEEV